MTYTTTTPNMALVLPVVGVQIDPTWAQNLITALTDRVDTHDHTPGNGVLVPTNGLIIDNDLQINHFNLLTVKSVSLDNQLSSPPLALDNPARLLVAYGENLWWQINASTAVQITSGGNLNTGAIATNVWEEVFTNTNASISPTDTFTYVMVDSTGGAINIALPAAIGVTQGRYYVIKDVGGAASTNNITVTPNGVDTVDGVATTRLISLNFGSFFIVSNGLNGWNIFRDGHLAATYTQLGVITLGGDLNGPGSTADVPKVVLATMADPGILTIGGDLIGDHTEQFVATLTGSAGHCTVIPGTNLDFLSSTSATFEAGSNLIIDGYCDVGVGATLYIDPSVVVSLTDAVLTSPATTGGTSLNETFTNPTLIGGSYTFDHLTVNIDETLPSGSILTAQAGAAIDVASGAAINMLGDLNIAAYPIFPSPAAIYRLINCADCQGTNNAVTVAKGASMAGNTVVSTASGTPIFLTASGSALSLGISICIDSYLINGSTLSQMLVSSQRGASTSPNAPAHNFRVGKFRRALVDATLTSMYSGGDFQEFTDSSGTQASVSYTVDQNNIIDKGAYTYSIQIWNENGNAYAQSGLKIYGVQIYMSNITVLGYQ